jgi:hypothetical protein
MSGSYVGSVYPESPRLLAPQKMLTDLGLGKYRRPVYGWVNEDKMLLELRQMHNRLSPTERAHIQEAIRIMAENGGIAAENPVTKLFK